MLVNDAGTTWGAPAEETPLHGWQKVIDVNLTGLFLMSQAAARQMIGAGRWRHSQHRLGGRAPWLAPRDDGRSGLFGQ